MYIRINDNYFKTSPKTHSKPKPNTTRGHNESEFERLFEVSWDHNAHTLLPTPNWSPYIFTLVQKVKIGHKKFMLL